jgi:small GTP-binding protein
MSEVVPKEFNICVLGSSEVGKTNLVARWATGQFSRKDDYKSTTTEEPIVTALKVNTSAGVAFVHLWDWAWHANRDANVNVPYLGMCKDGAIFVYSCIHRASHRDFDDAKNLYERSAGFEKPILIIGNKTDQKKRQVQDNEGKALASRGDHRAFVPVSLVESTGVDEAMEALMRLMYRDPILTVSGVKQASPEDLEAFQAAVKAAADAKAAKEAAEDAAKAAEGKKAKTKSTAGEAGEKKKKKKVKKKVEAATDGPSEE